MKLNEITINYLDANVHGYLSKEHGAKEQERYLRLDLGENLLGSADVSQALLHMDEGVFRYYADPSGKKIKTAIATLHNILPQNVTIANSSDELIEAIPQMAIDKHDACIALIPTFFRMIEASLHAGADMQYIHLLEEARFRVDKKIVNKLLQTISYTKPSLIWLCNPSNPTGEVMHLKDISSIAKATDALVIVDEAFYELYDPTNTNSAVKLINKHPNILVLRTLSKGYGLAGLRFGYAIAHSSIIEVVEKCRNTLLMTSGLVQELACAAIADQSFIHKTAHATKRNRVALLKEIGKLSHFHIGAETKTNVFLLKHTEKDLYEELLGRGIRTADFRGANGIEEKGYVRITIADQEKNNMLLSALKEIN